VTWERSDSIWADLLGSGRLTAVVEATGVNISNTGSLLRSLCRWLGPEVRGSVELRGRVDMMDYRGNRGRELC